MKIDKRVGFMTTSILEELCKEAMEIAWKNKDMKLFNEYLGKYVVLKSYNQYGNK